MFYTAAWCITDEKEFRKQLPLELLGESIKRYASSFSMNIVILEGIELLSAEYIRSLETFGFVIIDYCTEYRKILQEYKNIVLEYSRYERNCLLRWIAFKELFCNDIAGHPQFWHLDSDILLYTSLDELANDTRGKTFMLQGCPVLLTISDRKWFDLYEDNLKELNKDRKAYSARAALEKAACRLNDRELANNSFFRDPIGSDQDLLEYLVASRRIPQDNRNVIYNSKFFFIENPLALRLTGFDMQGEDDRSFELKDNLRIGIGRKLVPFIHYQGSFARYAQVFLLLKTLGLPGFILKSILAYNIEEDKFLTTLTYRIITRLWFTFHPGSGRSDTMSGFVNKRKGAYTASLLNFLQGKS